MILPPQKKFSSWRKIKVKAKGTPKYHRVNNDYPKFPNPLYWVKEAKDSHFIFLLLPSTRVS